MNIGELAAEFSLSRSALLYYDSIGLLRPSARTAANYRMYTVEDAERLRLICLYRDMGIELKDIGRLLDEQAGNTKILELALQSMEKKIGEIRSRQTKILDVMRKNAGSAANSAAVFTSVLRTLGLSDPEMKAFHAAYEQSDQAGHTAFLQFLGLSEREIAEVRERLHEK